MSPVSRIGSWLRMGPFQHFSNPVEFWSGSPTALAVRTPSRCHLVGSDQNARSEGRRLPVECTISSGTILPAGALVCRAMKGSFSAAVYPGVDLHYYGTEDQLEYDLVLQPGANLSR